MYFVVPPQDSTVVPVMYEFFSDTRNAAIHPISSGLPRRLSIVIPDSAPRTSSTVLPRALAIRSARGPQLSTSTVPGQRLLTNILNGARSFAMSLLNPMIAALDSVVDSAPGNSIVPDMPEIFSTRPAFDFLRCGLSLIHISEPTRLGMISYAVFCLKKKNKIKPGIHDRLRVKKKQERSHQPFSST